MHSVIEWNVTTGSTGTVYPCRCGVTHRGDYSQEDWNHHNCYHGPFWLMDPLPGIEQQIMCSDCGEVFELRAANERSK